MVKSRDLIGFCLVILVLNICVVAAVTDVAYLLKTNRNIPERVIDAIEDLDLTYDIILDTEIPYTNFDNYRAIIVGDERFRKKSYIPVGEHKMVIMNKYYGEMFGLTDGDGISQLAGTNPLSVEIPDTKRVKQVYTQAFLKSKIGLPYYYLSVENKASGFQSLADTYIGGENSPILGDVISVAPEGSRLVNGRFTDEKLCFYGITKSDYWTNDAEDLFKECLESVLISCYSDDDCDDGNDRTEDVCENPGTSNSRCEHYEIECFNDLECGENGFVGDNYCSIDGNSVRDYENHTCYDAGTRDSSCGFDVRAILQEVCADECVDGECIEIRCYNNDDCDDFDMFTLDICVYPGTEESYCNYDDISCFDDDDCGNNAYGNDYCLGDDVWHDFTSASCSLGGTIMSSCHSSYSPEFKQDCGNDSCDDWGNNYCLGGDVYRSRTCFDRGCIFGECFSNLVDEIELVESCSDTCYNGSCIDIACHNSSECDDYNDRTWDECVNNGTMASFCRNTEMNCLSDADCGITGFSGDNYCFLNDVYKTYQNSTCNNPATLESNCIISVFPSLLQDCNDFNDYTIDMCVENGHAFCEHTPLECLIDSDCADDYDTPWEYYCVGENSWRSRERHDFFCENLRCDENIIIENEFVEECDYECVSGFCVDEGHHDIRFIDMENAVNKIKIVGDSGIVFGNELLRGEDYQIYVNIKNKGDSYEDVSFIGESCVSFSHLPVTNFMPGDEKEKHTTVSFDCDEGCYNITITANLDSAVDENIFDNVVQREICIVDEPEIVCFNDADCGDSLTFDFCNDDNLFTNTTNYICANHGTGESYCFIDFLSNLKQNCGEDSCDDWGNNYCLGDNLWHDRNCVDTGCLGASCFVNNFIENEFVEECDNSCINGDVDILLESRSQSVGDYVCGGSGESKYFNPNDAPSGTDYMKISCKKSENSAATGHSICRMYSGNEKLFSFGSDGRTSYSKVISGEKNNLKVYADLQCTPRGKNPKITCSCSVKFYEEISGPLCI